MKGLALALLVAGCGGEEGVRVCVKGPEAASLYDTVEVQMTFTMGPSGPVCSPAHVLVGPSNLPYCVLVSPGARYDYSVVLRATGWQDADPLARKQVNVKFTPGELVEEDVVLDASCDVCAPEEQCGDTGCEPVGWQGVFDGSGVQVDPVACDPEHSE